MRPLGLVWFALFFVVVAGASACGFESEEPEPGEVVYSSTEVDFGEAEPRVWVIEPQDGADITSPFVVKMGHEGLILQGTRQTHKERYGHLHLLIDVPRPPAGEVIATDEQHLHYHNQQDETVLNLSPGQHTISLVFGTTGSRPWDPPIENTISVNVTGQQKVFFIKPTDAAQIKESPFPVKIGSSGIENVEGHYVIMHGPVVIPRPGEIVPENKNHIHLQPEQSETTLGLGGGGYTFQVVFVDENNAVTSPRISDSIDVTVWKAVGVVESENQSAPAFKITGRDKK